MKKTILAIAVLAVALQARETTTEEYIKSFKNIHERKGESEAQYCERLLEYKENKPDEPVKAFYLAVDREIDRVCKVKKSKKQLKKELDNKLNSKINSAKWECANTIISLVKQGARFDYKLNLRKVLFAELETSIFDDSKTTVYKNKDTKNTIVVFSGNTIQLQNAFGAWERARYVCKYDIKKDKIVNIDFK